MNPSQSLSPFTSIRWELLHSFLSLFFFFFPFPLQFSTIYRLFPSLCHSTSTLAKQLRDFESERGHSLFMSILSRAFFPLFFLLLFPIQTRGAINQSNLFQFAYHLSYHTIILSIHPLYLRFSSLLGSFLSFSLQTHSNHAQLSSLYQACLLR